MVDRVEFTTTPESGAERPAPTPPALNESRPAWLPENFKTPEDFAKSYADQRAEVTRAQQELAALKKTPVDAAPDKAAAGAKASAPEAPLTPEAKAKDDADKKAEETTKALESKGLDVNAMSNRFWSTGEVQEADLKALEAAGIPRDTVIDYANMQKDRQSATTNKLLEVAGGAAEFEAIATWARAQEDKSLATAYNKAYDSQNFTLMQQSLSALKAAYVAANGNDPKVVVNGGSLGASGGSYRSAAEMVRDMADPRYKTDEAYRNDVRAKIGRSGNF